MKKEDKKRKPRKELSTAINVLLVLIFAVVFVYFGICMGFLINSFINYSIDNIITNSVMTLVVGIVYMILLLILVRNSDSENVKPLKWYINCILISFTLNFIITAITVFTLGNQEGNDINYFIGFGMFPLIGIITTPNIVKHVKKDTAKWKDIFYKKGNLHNSKNDSKDYYRVHAPVSFEKKILSAVYKEQFKNILVVIGIMAFIIAICISYIIREHSYSENLIMNYVSYRAKRAIGLIFFLTIFFVAFGIPIIAYYVSNALKKVRVVKNHEYIAYHAIVSSVNNGNITICDNKKNYKYKYCTCVGIKEKDIHQTPATLIFLPDDVLLFPDERDTSFLRNRLIAHRGYYDIKKGIPENSILAFEEAIKNDLIIELDVHILKDGNVVVFHDDNIKRMTGIDKKIKDLKYSELDEIQLQETKQKIPLLKDVLELVDGKVPVIIELKYDTKCGLLEKEVIKILHNYTGRYAVKSFNPLSVKYFKKNYPEAIRGQLVSNFKNEKISKIKKILLSKMFFNFITKPDFISVDIKALPNNRIRKLRKNMLILGWTIRSKENMEFAENYCDNFICENIDFNKDVYTIISQTGNFEQLRSNEIEEKGEENER